MISPSDFRRQFGPADRKEPVSEESGAGCVTGFLGVTALAAVVFSASLGVRRCAPDKEPSGDLPAATSPQPNDQGEQMEVRAETP